MSWFDKIQQAFRTDLAMDLGTANTLMYAQGKGIILNEPSVVTLSKNGKLLAIGAKAKAMYGKTPDSVQVIRPMKDGVIADFDSTRQMIAYFIHSARTNRFSRPPKIIIGVPSGITQVEKKAVIDSASGAGAREVKLLEEPMAAAIGAKMPVDQSAGNLIIDIGGGTTEVAIISMYATAYVESIRVAGDELDEAIVRYLRHQHNLDIGIFEGERIKMAIGSAYPLEQTLKMKVIGKDLMKSAPKTIVLTDKDIREAMSEPVHAIIDAVRKALDNTTPELIRDIGKRGMVLAGGGSLIKGLGKALSEELKLPVYRAKDPLTAVVRGAGTVLEEWDTYKNVTIN